jgi:hypothetical protein
MKVLARDLTDGMTIEDADTGIRIYLTSVTNEGVIVVEGEASTEPIDGPDFGMEQDRWVTVADFDSLDIVRVVAFA